MNNKIIITLSLVILTACSNNNLVKPDNIFLSTKVEKKGLEKGILLIPFEEIVKLNPQKNKLSIKSLAPSPINTVKLSIEIIEPETKKATTYYIDYRSQSSNSRSSFVVTFGKNRLVILKYLDENDNIISSVMGVTDVLAGKFNTVKLNYFNTCIGQIIKNILEGSNPNLLTTLDLDLLKTNVKNLTGYDEISNTFTKKDPLTLNTVKIANLMSTNNGIFPNESEPNLFGLASVNLNLNELGTRVLLSDLNSNVISGTNLNTVSINNISPGTWNLTITKAGFKTISQQVKLESNQTLPLNLNLVKDNDVMLEGVVVGSLSAIDTDISETSVEQAIFNGK